MLSVELQHRLRLLNRLLRFGDRLLIHQLKTVVDALADDRADLRPPLQDQRLHALHLVVGAFNVGVLDRLDHLLTLQRVNRLHELRVVRRQDVVRRLFLLDQIERRQHLIRAPAVVLELVELGLRGDQHELRRQLVVGHLRRLRHRVGLHDRVLVDVVVHHQARLLGRQRGAQRFVLLDVLLALLDLIRQVALHLVLAPLHEGAGERVRHPRRLG